ncbi:MAG TPA: DUF192 domain-containing protein [Vicinamibacterales bacterium]
MNARTSQAVAKDVELADTRATRRKGLLGRDSLDAGAALIIRPCFSVHTAFMRFPIDVLFVDRAGTVVKVVRNLAAWRIAGAWGAHAAIELAAGAIPEGAVEAGDRLYLSAEAAPAGTVVSWPLPA